MSKTKVIAFANNKGGSRKTTTCSNVGCAMALDGKKVLMLDGDMQMNLTISYFDEEQALEFAKNGKTIYTAIKEEKDLSDFIVNTGIENLDIVPSSSLMSAIEFDLFSKWQRELILLKSLEKICARGYYDYVLIDAPPTLGGWVMNIMCASDYLVVPVEASPWGLFGLANMFDFVGQVRSIAPTLKVLGVAITKADERKNYFHQTVETLRSLEDVKLFETFIRIDSSIEWAQDNSKPVGAYKKSSRSAKEYAQLTKEIINDVSR
jgi:chromosome partitioning protein